MTGSRLMQIGPKAIESNISDYVTQKFSENRGSGTLDDHYGYPNPNTQSPTNKEVESLHEKLSKSWGGEVPTVLDPTAGRGIIPFEALRYGLPTKASELNPVPSLILKSALEYIPKVGSLEPEISQWRDKIHKTAKENIESYYPTEEPDREILNSAFTYLIECDSCQGNIPLTSKWWLDKTTNGGDAIRPIYEDGKVEYEHIKIDDSTDVEYDPSSAPVTRGSAECPHCGVITEKDQLQNKICDGEFEYSIYGVNYETSNGEWGFRAGSEVDDEGIKKSIKRVESDFNLITFLTEPINVSSRINDPSNWGMEAWQDIFTPRQLVVNYEYVSAYRQYVPKIREKHNSEKAEAILTILSFCISRSMNLNTRLNKWKDQRGIGSELFTDNNYAIKKMAVDNNLSAPRRGFVKNSDHVISSYETLSTYTSTGPSGELISMDAANLTQQWSKESIDVAVVDPPYYSSILYAELSDIYYVILKECLQDVHSELFDSKLTNKSDEAIANPARFENIAEDSKSKQDLAHEFYEEKMQDIFTEVQELLTPGGVMTVMFTHREMDAWDTLTTALINAGFTITATHPIKTEMKDRVGGQGRVSADSSILLVGRKDNEDSDTETTLWEDIESDIRTVAKNEAENILDSGYTISKTDTAIAAYGPTLQKFAKSHPVINKKGEEIRPRRALAEARNAVTSVIAERYLETDGIGKLDSLTRWYILVWLIYENDTIPYDEGRQLGMGTGIDIDEIKRSTKIWGKKTGDVQIKTHQDRVQDIIILRDDSVSNPSSRKYPVNPTDDRFTYTIDAIHASLHVYERDGAKAAWDWLTERDLKSDNAFEVAVTALLEVLPEDEDMYEILVNIVSGETGEYLNINLDHIDMSQGKRQTELNEHTK
jgi:adenine-specific DNA methylase